VAAGASTFNGAGLMREVLGFATYWELASGDLSDLQDDKLSTISYFGATYTAQGTFVNGDPGGTGWNSQALTNLVNQAHSAGDKVVVTVKSFSNSVISSIVNNSGNGQTAISQAIFLMHQRSLDGINVDFEGSDSSLQQPYTNWIANLSNQVHSQYPGSFLSVDTYSGSASWTGGFMRIDTLAPHVDAFFVMAYDMGISNASAQGLPPTLPNAPLGGSYTYNDTLSVDQYLAATGDPNKVILGVPYYGYKSSTQSSAFNAPINTNDTSGCAVNCADTYSITRSEFQCAQSLSSHVDGASSTPWAAWFSPPNDPCTAPNPGHNSIRELYYEDVGSLQSKYDLVNNRNIRGIGIWALGYDHGYTDLWGAIAAKFLNSDAQWSAWYSLAAGMTGPAVGTNADGRLEIVGVATNHTAWHTWQNSPSSGWNVGASLGGSLASSPAIARNSDGRMEVFAVGGDGGLWHIWQTSAGGNWSGWVRLGGGSLGTPTVGTDADGRLELFVLAADHSVFHAWQQPGGSGWSGFVSLGGSVTNVPTVGRNSDGRLEIFAAGSDSGWHAWQIAANGSWSGWASLGGQISGSPVVITNSDGRLEAFAVTPYGSLYHLWQTAPGAGWTVWAPLGGYLTSAPAVARTPGGRLFVFGTGTDGGAWRQVQTTVNGAWGGWSSMAGPGLVNVVTGTNADGRLELFAPSRASAIWHSWQLSPST
jgi:spore germination protein YaaH